ncbi:hypothetical protein Dimus_031374 [Dionaea muscipula]
MAATSTSEVTATTAAGNTADGPVLNLINKRLRALRKKQNRIVQMEESLSQGKTLNSEQQELLRSKSSVLCLIDELEKLRSPLSSAVSEEISLALCQQQDPLPLNRVLPEELEQASAAVEEGDKTDALVEDLLSLLYFGSLFDVMHPSAFTSLMLTRTHERGCCLTYDYVMDDAATDPLGEKDLDLVSALKRLLISRPVDSDLSHKNALRHCIEHAKLWIAKSDQPIAPGSDATYAGLREKLDKIRSSEYYTTTPEMKAPVEMAAAAAAGRFVSFEVSVGQDPEMWKEMQEENIACDEEYETTAENPADPVDELPKENFDTQKPLQEVPVQTDQVQQQQQQQQEVDGEENSRDVEPLKEQQHTPRRTFQHQRGGRGSGNSGWRGYPNGRGGGRGGRGPPYQNGGRNNQYFDQPGNYYPRNYNRGRGGRGSGRNNYYHGSTSSTANGGHGQANAGVAS